MARDVATDFKVINILEVDALLLLPELKSLAETKSQLEAQIINKRVAELELKQIKAAPYCSVNTAYNFQKSQSSLGFVAQSQSRGLNYGFSASLNLFDGLHKIEMKNC
jgi:outer membrane protein TolC